MKKTTLILLLLSTRFFAQSQDMKGMDMGKKETKQQQPAATYPLAVGVLYKQGILLSPAAGAVLMTVSTVVVAINASFLKVKKV